MTGRRAPAALRTRLRHSAPHRWGPQCLPGVRGRVGRAGTLLGPGPSAARATVAG